MAFTDTERLDWVLEQVKQSGGVQLERRIGTTGTRNELDLAMHKDVADEERRRRTKLALFREKLYNMLNSEEFTDAELADVIGEIQAERDLKNSPTR